MRPALAFVFGAAVGLVGSGVPIGMYAIYKAPAIMESMGKLTQTSTESFARADRKCVCAPGAADTNDVRGILDNDVKQMNEAVKQMNIEVQKTFGTPGF